MMGTHSRRRFLQACVTCAGANLATGAFARTSSGGVFSADPPLAPSAFYPLPLGSIKPRGWLARQLRVQADGLSGHLPQTWPDVGANSGWLGGSGEAGERGPYYLDGLVPLAYLLEDARLQASAQSFIEWTLKSQKPSGMFGPERDEDWWTRMVMLKALMQYQEATGDPRVIPFMQRYFHYQYGTLPQRPLTSWGKFRWQDEALAVAWLYRRTADSSLLKLAAMLRVQGHDWVAGYRNFQYKEPVTWAVIHAHGDDGSGDFALASHGVNNGMALKTGPVWYLFSGKAADRDAVFEALDALDRYHGLPNGMFSCDEHLAGTDPVHGTELCTVVETMFSLEQALAITGSARLADRLELIAFNPLPGAFTDDMWAHQYNQQSNQVECSVHTKPWTTDGPESNLYGLAPHFGCCTANYHQGWPKFTASTFMRTQDDGFVATLYAPVEMHSELHGQRVSILEETEYPFRDEVRFHFKLDHPMHFPFAVRIPHWCKQPHVTVNGRAQQVTVAADFLRLSREWKDGDMVMVHLPSAPRMEAGAQNSVSVYQGPLLFSFPIKESWLKLRQRGLTADWQVYPASQWNYALLGAGSQPTPAYHPVGTRPFAAEGVGVTLQVAAAKVPEWRALDSTANPVPSVTRQDLQQPIEEITLTPYAAAKLRVSAFPHRVPATGKEEVGL